MEILHTIILGAIRYFLSVFHKTDRAQ